MVNVNSLRSKIAEKGLTVPELAKRIKMDKSTLYRKLSDGENFSIGEANLIAKELKLTSKEAMSIFFAASVA